MFKKKKAVCVFTACIVALVCVLVMIYRMITNIIVDFHEDTMRELTLHDESAINSMLNSRWNIMLEIAEDVREVKCNKVEQIINELSKGEDYLDCKAVVLVSDSGMLYSSTGNIKENYALFNLCKNKRDQFVFRYDGLKDMSTDIGEVLVMGCKISPIIVEDTSFSYIVALVGNETFQKEFMIDGYGGEGYSAVINSEGYYIININKAHKMNFHTNFFADIEDASLQDYDSVPELKEKLKNKEEALVTGIEIEKKDYIFVFTPFPYAEWYFVTAAPQSVFNKQTVKIIRVFIVMMVLILFAVISVTFLVLRDRQQKLQMRAENIHKKELAHALNQANQANSAKTIFLNRMSHDIRTPINAMLGFSKLASMHKEEPELVREYLDKSLQSSEHLISIINDVLDMSCIESGKMYINETKENLRDILQEICSMEEAQMKEKKHVFRKDFTQITHDMIVCDKMRLKQVLINILTNSVKYTKNNGVIEFTVIEKKAKEGFGNYEFHIKDNGVGMSETFLEDIFEPFSREQKEDVSSIQGTGLGLPIAKNLAELMNGTITCKSKLNEGTEFIVSFYFKIDDKINENVRKQTESNEKINRVIRNMKRQYSGMRVLLVEDYPLNQEIAMEVLKDMGMIGEVAENGEAAFEKVKEKEAGYYGFVLMDIQMPIMDGYSATKKIREIEDKEKAQIPIIAMTANVFKEEIIKAFDAGMDGYISKPVDLELLQEEIERALGKKS